MDLLEIPERTEGRRVASLGQISHYRLALNYKTQGV